MLLRNFDKLTSSNFAHKFNFNWLQQLETIQKSIEPLQDGILGLLAVASLITNEAHLQALNVNLDSVRKAEKELRDRLFMIQIAKKYDWEAANKMARRKAGEYDDPELSKVLEEREKKEEKEKKEKAKLATSMKAKRGGRFYGSPAPFYGGFRGYGSVPYGPGPSMTSPNFSHEFGASSRRGFFRSPGAGPSFGRRPSRGNDNCHTCGQAGHFWKVCPNQK